MAEYQLSDWLQKLPGSQTLEMAAKGRELREKGVDVIALNLGEPDFVTPDHIREAAKMAVDEGWTFYPPVSGYGELRKAIAAKLKRDCGLDYADAQIVVSTGAKQSLANLKLALLNPGDEVLIFAPYWVSYYAQVLMTGAAPKLVKGGIDSDFKVTPDQLREAITDRTRMVVFSSPCNPTGSVYSREELKALAEVLAQHPKIYVVSDEIYEHITFGVKHESIAQFAEVADQTIVVNGFSKGFAMTGWRVGYIAAPQPIAKACEKIQGQFTSGACSIAQRAAIAAAQGPLDACHQMAKAYRHRRDMVKSLLDKVPGFKTNLPQGAFYIFPDVSELFGKSSSGGQVIRNSYDLAMYLLNEAHVSVVSGEGFGAEECVRISYAASEEQLKEGMERIKAAVSKLA